MVAAILMRTPSFQAHHLPIVSPRSSPAVGGGGGYFLRQSRSTKLFPRSSIQLDVNEGNSREGESDRNPIRRARSNTDLHLGSRKPSSHAVHWSPPAAVEEEQDAAGLSVGDLWKATPPAAAAAEEDEQDELQYSGDGTGKGRTIGGGRGSDDSNRSENKRMRDYYQEMLRSDPANPLLLRNYGRFLHEVEGDVKRAEDCYRRAILASPGDGDVLSLYGRLLWEAHGDGERAGAYFERAVQAAPDDCYVLGSYAKFLWEADDEEEEEKGSMAASPSSTLARSL